MAAFNACVPTGGQIGEARFPPFWLLAALSRPATARDPKSDLQRFGAARLNLKIADVPIRYRERTYGTTNIQRWSHGWLLLRMVLFAARKVKFI